MKKKAHKYTNIIFHTNIIRWQCNLEYFAFHPASILSWLSFIFFLDGLHTVLIIFPHILEMMLVREISRQFWASFFLVSALIKWDYMCPLPLYWDFPSLDWITNHELVLLNVHCTLLEHDLISGPIAFLLSGDFKSPIINLSKTSTLPPKK